MHKKNRISPVQNFQVNTAIETGNLPAPAEVQQTVAFVTGKTPPLPKPKKETAPKPAVTKPRATPPPPVVVERVVETVRYGRPVKTVAIGREKFTTMLQPDLIRLLKRTAIDSGQTVADLLEGLIRQELQSGNKTKMP